MKDPRSASLMALKQWAHHSGVEFAQLQRVEEGLASTEPRGAPHQRAAVLCPGLEAKPWHDATRFEWLGAVEQASAAIKFEMLAQYERIGTHPEAAALADRGQWNSFYFYYMGKRSDENHALCPHTARVLAQVPGIESAGMAYFSVMAPGTHVKAHCGFTNTRIRIHLGLVVPPDCTMRVGAETRSWQEGKCSIFDDSFEHEVNNNSDRYRAVLLFDTWHPDLTPVERQALTFLMNGWKDYLA
ncbi:aspartyl/asparaginyl beta-hydroxylase domain-containing protein [Stigmatella erecta]|uniref:Aspartate beta-hydroxylase n=1 Tax=Stigmatella erecta TaxID=83460 RepID=A0A1H9YT27_9BACT|nr:aspartyl/asparaginyl beta-hydroxylase domain-containing protein [Stigmatella erecta]SES71695.1 aspartate beta-hydroxylase [Stigmatella erecta]